MRRPARPSAGPAIQERAFHRWLAAHLPAGHDRLLGLGDDAAALRAPRGMVAVVSTDALVEGSHFLAGSRPDLVGRAAAAVSLSDIAAKGARPAGVLLALIVPPGTPEQWAREVARGAEREGARFGAHLVGGDTKPGPTKTLVSTVIGWARPAELAPRAGARPGDLLVTTGTVGRGGLAFHGLSHSERRKALAGMLDVRPRVREGRVLAPLAHAMLDTSDGIADAAAFLAEASRVRLVVEEARLPLAPGIGRVARSDWVRRCLAFYGGDYELLAAVPPNRVARATRAVRAVRGRLSIVGRVERGEGAFLRTDGGIVPMPAAGWRPFDHPSGR